MRVARAPYVGCFPGRRCTGVISPAFRPVHRRRMRTCPHARIVCATRDSLAPPYATGAACGTPIAPDVADNSPANQIFRSPSLARAWRSPREPMSAHSKVSDVFEISHVRTGAIIARVSSCRISFDLSPLCAGWSARLRRALRLYLHGMRAGGSRSNLHLSALCARDRCASPRPRERSLAARERWGAWWGRARCVPVCESS
jgi:hypothetical protein